VEVHDHLKAAIVQVAELAVVRRGVDDLVEISLKSVICLHILLHGFPRGLFGGRLA
jgi:hypothetical protein